MANPRILIIPGSLRTGSHNVRLAALAVKELALIDIELAGESGAGVARGLAKATGGRTAVILISAHAGEDVADFVAETPAAGFLPKARLSAAAIMELVKSP